MNHGLTLTSLMVAVALSGVLAVAAARLVVNQMTTLRVMELRDKGDSIFKFYSNLLHDDKVWWCTLYDGDPNTSTPNSTLRNCVLKGSCSSGEQPMRLMGPNCTIKFKANGERDFSTGNFTVGTEFIPPGSGKFLKDSVTENVSNGWWNVKVTWEHRGSAAVDLVLTQTLNEERWKTAATGKRYTPDLQDRELRVRRSANYVRSNSDTTKAVTKIALHTANRQVSQHNDPLVKVKTGTTTDALGNCHEHIPFGQVVMSTTDCSGDRVAVTPKDCVSQYSVIAQIGTGADITAAKNVRCALRDGSGKMVQYRDCGRVYETEDRCTVQGQNFAARKNYVPAAITGISSTGTQVCKGLPSWPTNTQNYVRRWPFTPSAQQYLVYGQGPIGPKGADGSGPQGPRGYAWNDHRCN